MKKFKVAIDGLIEAFHHKAVKLQFFLGVLAVAGGFIIGLNINEWLIFLLCIGIVLMAELFNTCIEKICDFIEPNQNEKIKVIKDISAGAVLVASVMALIICILITIMKIGGK